MLHQTRVAPPPLKFLTQHHCRQLHRQAQAQQELATRFTIPDCALIQHGVGEICWLSVCQKFFVLIVGFATTEAGDSQAPLQE